MTLRPQDLPSQLVNAPHWVGWRYETRNGSGKSTKVPYCLTTGRKASSTNPTDWASFDIARELAARYDGIGWVFTKDLQMSGVDLDDCYDAAGQIKPWAIEKLRQFGLTYHEVSPSGKGIKLFCGGNLAPGLPGLKVFVNAKGEPVKEGDPTVDGAIEIYDCGRYFTVTGDSLGPLDIANCQQQIDALYLKLRSARNSTHQSGPVPGDAAVAAGSRHKYLMANAGGWRQNGLDRDGILIGLRLLNQAKCNPPKSEHELCGIADFIARKHPQYRLVPRDFERSLLHTNGYSASTPDNDRAPDTLSADIDSQLLSLVDQAIASKDPAQCYGDEIFELAAQSAGSTALIARGKLKDAFGSDMVLSGVPGSWNERFREATRQLRRSYVRDPDPSVSPTPDDGNHGLTNVIVSNRQLRDISTDCVCTLHAHNDPPSLFVRTGELVHIVRDEAERPSVEIVNEAYLRGVLARAANFMKIDNRGELRNAFPPVDVVKDIVAFDPVSWPFPPLMSVVEVPTLRPDGTILCEPGYDPASHIFYAPASTLQTFPLPESPTQSDVRDARDLLDEAFGEFPFADAASKANLFGLLLTAVVRPAITGCTPLAVVDAPQAGTGKSLLIDVVSMIATGRPSAMVPYPHKEEELQKQILASLIASRQLICFDNLAGELSSAALAMVLTAKEYESRVLGFSKNVIIPNRSTWIVTGNNIRPGGDMPRRCYQIRLNAKTSKPYSGRKFKHPDLLRWVEDKRSELLHALLIIARHWYSSGCPEHVTSPIGSFEEWHQKVGSMVMLARVPGFLANYADFIDQEDEKPREWAGFLAFLFEWSATHNSSRPFSVADLMQRVQMSETSPLRDALPAEIADCLERKQNHRIVVGKMFTSQKERRFGDGEYQYWLERVPNDSDHKGSASWQIMREKVSLYAPPAQSAE